MIAYSVCSSKKLDLVLFSSRMCALGYCWYLTVKLRSIIIMDSILFVCLAVVDCWLLCFSTNCTLYSKVFCLIITRVMLKVWGSSLSNRVTTRSCFKSSPMGGSTWATTTTRVVPAVSTLTGRCYYTLHVRGHQWWWNGVAAHWWQLMAAVQCGYWWVVQFGWLLEVGHPLEMYQRSVGPWRRYFHVEVEGLHQPDSEPSGEDQEAADQRHRGRWLREGEPCWFLRWLAWYIGGDRFGGFDVLWCFCVFGLLFGRALCVRRGSRGDIWVIEKGNTNNDKSKWVWPFNAWIWLGQITPEIPNYVRAT